MAFENLSKDQFEELRRRAQQQKNARLSTTPQQSGSNAFQDTKKQADWNDVINPIQAAQNFAGNALGTAAAVGGFAGQNIMAGLGKVAGGLLEGTALTGLEALQGASNLGKAGYEALTGQGDKVLGSLDQARKDAVQSGMALSGGVGKVIGGAGQAALGAISGAATPVVSAGAATGEYVKDIAEAAAPDQVRGIEDTLGGIGKGAVEGATNIGKGAMDVVDKSFRSIGFEGEDLNTLKQQTVSSIDTVGAAVGGTAMKAVAAPLAQKLGQTALGQATKRMATEAAAMIATKKSVSGGWLDAVGKQIRDGSSALLRKATNQPIPEDIPVSQFVKSYMKDRANAFYGSNFAKNTALGKTIAVTSKVTAPAVKFGAELAYQTSPLNYGSKLTAAAAKETYRMSKYGYNAVKTMFGSKVAKDISAAAPVDSKLVSSLGLDPKDMEQTMRINSDIVNRVKVSELGRVRTASQEAITVAQNAMKRADVDLKSVGEAVRGYTGAVANAADNFVKEGMGTFGAFYENTRTKLVSMIDNDVVTAAPGTVRKALGDMAANLGRNQTIEVLKGMQDKLGMLLRGEGIDAADLAQNKQTLGQLFNAVTKDLETTMGRMDPGLAAAFKNIDSGLDEMTEQATRAVKDEVQKAPTDAAKRKVFRKSVLSSLAGVSDDVLAPMADRLAGIADTFFEDGAVAFSEAVKGTPFEKMAEWKVVKGLMPDEVHDMIAVGDDEFIKMEQKGFRGHLADLADYVAIKGTNLIDNNTLTKALLANPSDDNFKRFATAWDLDPKTPEMVMHGDVGQLQKKLDMTKLAEKYAGRSATDARPLDIPGQEILRESDTLDAARVIAGKDLEQKLKSMAGERIDISDPYLDFVSELNRMLEVNIDDTGNIKIADGSIISVTPSERRKLENVFKQIRSRADVGADGTMSLDLENLQKIDTLLDDIPGVFQSSPTGKSGLQTQLETLVTKYRENVKRGLPQEVRDAQTNYATVMDARRTLFELGGITDKNYNQLTVWQPSTVPDAAGQRVLTEAAAKGLGRNLEKLTSGPQAAKYERLYREIYTASRDLQETNKAMSDIYNIVEYNRLLSEMLGQPVTTMAGNTGTYRGTAALTETGYGSFLSRLKNRGLGSAVTGVITAESTDAAKMVAVKNLLENQLRIVSKNGERAYYMQNLLTSEFVPDAPTYQTRWKMPEDTAQTTGLGDETGMKVQRAATPSQTLPDDESQFPGNAGAALTGMDTGPEDEYPF